jgi:Mrp family chromosome partitioning ATPase
MIQEDVQTQKRQVADLSAQLAAAQGSAADLGGRNVEYSQLREDVRTHREWYDKVETRRAAAALTSKFRDSGLLRVADRAVPAGKPVKPSKPLAAVAAAMVFGLTLIVLPIGWGFYDDHVKKLLSGKGTFNSAEEEEMMAARVSPFSYGTAPQHAVRPFVAPEPQAPPPTGYLPSPFSTVQASQPLYAATRPMAEASPFTAVPPQQAKPQPAATSQLRPAERDLTTIARLPYVHANAPEAILAQLLKPEPLGASGALHNLTGTIERQAANRASSGGIILITSAEAREGKTLVASTLAAALCHQGRSVFMMECNPSSPTLHQWFPRSRGFEAWASDLESLRYSHTNLFLLPGRDLPAHATNELLDGYRTWIDRAKPHVDWIILDASPLLKSFANVAPLAPLATDVILVSNPSISAAAKIRAAIALLQPMMSSSALRGMVLNGV